MKLPYDPPTMVSDLVSSIVMLAILLAAWAWIVTRAAGELPGAGKGRGDAGTGMPP